MIVLYRVGLLVMNRTTVYEWSGKIGQKTYFGKNLLVVEG
jgi:hypothetical protein